MRTITTNSPEETIAIGAKLGHKLREGDLVALKGELGTGKTMFVKGLAKGIGVEDHLHVNSPSFVILKEYRGQTDLYHFDIYRLDQKHFTETLDYERYFYNSGITVIEWAEKIKDILPDEYLEIGIAHIGPTERKFEFRVHGDRYERLLSFL